MPSIRPRRFVIRALFAIAAGPWSPVSTAPAQAHAPGAAILLHVAPDGNDRWSGRLARPDATPADGPLATLRGARDRVRVLRKETPAATGPIIVSFADGTYPLTEPVDFEPQDGGTAASPVVYRADDGAHPILDGGRSVEGLHPGPDRLWTARLDWAAPESGKAPFEQLYIKGKRAVRARLPNEFFYPVAGRLARVRDPATGRLTAMERRGFLARPEDVRPLAGLSPEALRDVTVVAYHAWEASRHHVAGVEPGSGRVILTGPAPWPFLQWGPYQRYHVENLRAALDAPGEWFLDRDGTLLYMPLPGEEPGRVSVVAPLADAFLRIRGNPRAGQLVEHLRFEGLTFRHARYLLPPEGHGDGQAAASIPAVVMADGAQHIALVGCRIEHTGTYGIWFRRGCRDCRIDRCALLDLGAGGVRIGETGIAADPRDRTGSITLNNCIIRGTGRIFPGSVAVWIGQSGDNVVTHNDIADTFYTGISVGWSWGYADTLSQRNIIEFNHIHHLGRGLLSDMGGVYTLGIARGTSVSHNVIHDVDSYNLYGRGGWGLYNDEGSTGIRLEGNLVYNTSTGSYHQHYGRENVVVNNILAFSRDGQLQRSREEPHLSFTLERNIIIWDDGPLLSGTWSNGHFRLDHNLYYRTGGQPFDFAGRSLDAWRKATGQDVHSVVAEPRFVDASRRDFRLEEGSPALALGFRPFDAVRAGVEGDPAWAAEAAAPLPPTRFAPEPPPPGFHEDFEESAGASGDPYVPAGAHAAHEGRPELLAITDRTAATGRQSLRLTDVAGLQHPWDPHFFYQPHYRRGVVTCSFAVRLDPGAVFFHEWRDGATPYRVGPSLRIEEGTLQVAGRAVPDLKIPPGEWVPIEVKAPVEPRPGRTWSLSVTLPGQPARRLDGLECSPAWASLDWIGFVSDANRPTAIYLDDLELADQL